MNPETYDFHDHTGDDESVEPTVVPVVLPMAAFAVRRRRATVRVRTAAGGALLLVAALVATTVWAIGVKSDADHAFAEATSTRQATAEAVASIQQSRRDITTEESAVALSIEVNAKLQRQVENQAICASAQRADLASLKKIFDDSRANFEKATKGSKLFAAYAATKKALDAAVADLVKAYRAAAAGSLTTANSWVDASNTQVSIAIKQSKILDKEIDKVNATTDRITGAQTALDLRLDATAVTCGA
jgi:hypothetical protein